MSQQYSRNTAYYNQRPHGLNVNNPGYTTYRDVSNVNRRTEAFSPMIYRDSRQGNGNQERVSQFGYQQDYNKTSSSARKGLPFNNTSRLDFEAEFGLQDGRGHDGIGYQDDRIQNILLDEICSDFGIKDSIDLDLYNLDSVYPSTRLSDDLEELDQTIPFGKFDAEAELGGSLMPPPSVPNRMRSQQIHTSGLVKGYQSKNGPPLTQGFIEKIEAVASPTISSSCEGGTSLAAVSGTPVVVKPQPPDSTSGDCVEEELTKGVSGEFTCGEKVSNDKVKCQKKEESGNTNNYSSHVKLENCIPESQPVQASGGRNVNMSGELNSKVASQVPSSMPASRRPPSCSIPNFSASPSARSSYQNTVQGSAVNRCPPTTVGCDGGAGFRGGMVAVPVVEEANAGESGAPSCSTSTSVSPSQMHVAKKIRTINSGSDLLEEVRECFAYVHGADLFAPTSHSSFNDPSADAFKPQFDSQKNMNFGGNANFTGGRAYIQQPLQQMQQPGPGCYPQGGDGFSDTPTRRTIAPKSYVGDQFGGMERSRGVEGGGYGPAVSFNVSSPSVGSLGYQSCPDLTSPARQVQPFSPGVQSSSYQSRPYSPAGINRVSQQQYDMGTIPLANQQHQQPMMENMRNPTMNQRSNNSQGYAQVMPFSMKQDGSIGYDVSRNSPRPAHFPQKAMPQSPASFQMHQSQTQSAPCTPSKQKWDSMYHQSGALQAEAYRGSPSSSGMTMSHGGAQQMMYPRESTGGASMHTPSLGRMQENQYTMNNNNVCPTPGKTMGNECMDRINRSGMMGRNDLVSGSYNSPSQDGRPRDDPRYSSYSPGVNMNNYRRGTNYPVVPDRLTGREMYRNDSNMAPVNTASHHASRAPQNYGAFVNTGAPAHDLPLSQHGFLRRLIGEDSGAFSAHPLYPLLRDLIIADMNFHTPSFPFPLIANLPCEFEKLLDNYRSRNPGLVLDHADPTVQMVVIDAVKYAHSALIGKIQSRRRAEGYVEKPTQNMDDFCDNFERSVTRAPDCQSERGIQQHPDFRPMYSDVNCGSGPPSGFAVPYPVEYNRGGGAYPEGDTMIPHRVMSADMSSSMPYGLNYMPHAPHLYYDDDRLVQSLPSSPRKLLFKQMGGEGEKAGKNKVLPKEAVSVMIEWLREHQENPYPNDDEKESLIESTKLTINQINYWFTNARRRILPKWALQRHIAEQEKGRQNNKSTAELIEDRERSLQRHGSPKTVGGD